MILLQAGIFCMAIYLGLRLHGIGIGIVSCLTLLLFIVVFGIVPTKPPLDVLLMIMAASTAAAALEVSGTLDLLSVKAAEKFVYYPHLFVWVSAILTYISVFLLGTSHIMYAIFPVLVRVSKKAGLPPVRPLVASVIASEQAVLASPMSAPNHIIVHFFEEGGYTEVQSTWLTTIIPATILGTCVATWLASRQGRDLGYCVLDNPRQERRSTPLAHGAIGLFLLGVLLVMIRSKVAPTGMNAIEFNVVVLLAVAGVIALFTGTAKIVGTHVFRIGMQSVIALLGVAWLSNSFLQHHQAQFEAFAQSNLTRTWQWGLLFFGVTVVTSSQSASLQMLLTKTTIAPNIYFRHVITAANSFYVLPSSPLVLAAMTIDDTGSTYAGTYFINHAFLLPGLAGTLTSYVVASMLIG